MGVKPTSFPTDWCSSWECSTEIYFERELFANWLVFQLRIVPADAEKRVHGQNLDFTHKLKKNQKVRFQTKIEQKPHIIAIFFTKCVVFFIKGTSSFLGSFSWKNRNKF